jgi:hypothetical protein
MKRLKKSRRIELPLSSPTQKRLSTYAAAAGAAGVGLLALAPIAGAEIVYTPVNQTIGRNGSYNLDLNNDGVVDFILIERVGKDGSFGATDQIVALEAATGNQAVCPSTFCISGDTYAEPLIAGVSIRPTMRPRGWTGRQIPMAFEDVIDGRTYFGYGWTNLKNRYLGLKFKVNGEYHYGWARLSLQFHAGSGQDRTWVMQLTGYAYETVACESIITGQTSGGNKFQGQSQDQYKDQSDASTGLKPEAFFAVLGTLALGADGLNLWRRKDN